MSLPLLQKAGTGDPRFVSGGQACGLGHGLHPRIPGRTPAEGEQYRFHFDMTKCIGCRCCEVACAEQNGNPAGIDWRRVGEIEGGFYPNTQRFYLSMGCNHCLEAACLKGCPVEAYTKDAATGVVLHSADICIGCQYCTWNCPYGVPQFNEERGVVGKCDLCHNRLAEGREPACVSACPEGAIEIEIVDVSAWRADHATAEAPGLPPARDTLSTTRLTLPDGLTPDAQRVDRNRLMREEPHWPLVFMLTLTQLSVGAFWSLSLLSSPPAMAGVAAFLVAALALGASTMHLGRPAHAWRALKMWRRSWLSREVLLFSLFAGAASLYAALALAGQPERALCVTAAALGLAGVTASAFIYMVPARPAWNSSATLADFYLTGALLGPLLLGAIGIPVPGWAVAAAALGQLLNLSVRMLRLARSEEFERNASARLMAREAEALFLVRLALLALGGIALPMAGFMKAALAAALAGEIVSRYLFFVTVVPRSMAAPFSGRERA